MPRRAAPRGTRGPWETACADQGLDGRMQLVLVQPDAVLPDDVAADLQVPSGARGVHRRQLAVIGTADVVQVQDAWYPADLAAGTPLEQDGKIKGGIYGALTALGRTPTSARERITSRTPTAPEASQLNIGGKVPVIAVDRITKDQAGQPVEVLRVIAPADRVELVYDDLPLG
ncbi:UTRA domain-containing protein [Streptomyces sp. NPDC004609]|uniref:UTRA domain-containing protein n=1 Tax=Streptomyces sp. NPDC004609 TaxID=3364704 RepID=UPI0036AD1BE1